MDLAVNGTPRLIFVTGHPRSGTTLLAVLLDRHSLLAGTAETHFFRVHAALEREKGAIAIDELLARWEADRHFPDLKLTRAEILAECGSPATPARIFEAAMRLCGKRQGKPIVVEKTPGHLYDVTTILSWYPDAKMVAVVRDGRACFASISRTPWARRSPRFIADRWNEHAQIAAAFAKDRPDVFHLVYYERLVREPEAELRRICAFLGMAFEPGMLSASRGSEVVPAWELRWKAKATQAVDPSSAEAWRNELSSLQSWWLSVLMARWLRHFGYPLPRLAAAAGRPWELVQRVIRKARGLLARVR